MDYWTLWIDFWREKKDHDLFWGKREITGNLSSIYQKSKKSREDGKMSGNDNCRKVLDIAIGKEGPYLTRAGPRPQLHNFSCWQTLDKWKLFTPYQID